MHVRKGGAGGGGCVGIFRLTDIYDLCERHYKNIHVFKERTIDTTNETETTSETKENQNIERGFVDIHEMRQIKMFI